jgi:hypothetical protein
MRTYSALCLIYVMTMCAIPARAEVDTIFKGGKAISVTNLVGKIEKSSECTTENMQGMFVKREFEKDGIKPKGYVFEKADGERIYINAPALDINEIGHASYGAALSALGQLTREGQRVRISVVWCAKAMTLQSVWALGVPH